MTAERQAQQPAQAGLEPEPGARSIRRSGWFGEASADVWAGAVIPGAKKRFARPGRGSRREEVFAARADS
jgi:hypothetical protein